MNKKRSKTPFILIAGLLGTGFCLLATLILFGSGLAFLFTDSNIAAFSSSAQPASRTFTVAELPPLPTDTLTPIATFTPEPTHTSTPVDTPTPTPLPTNTPLPPPTDTPVPTNTPLPPATNTPAPTSTSLPTDTPTPLPPDYPFVIKETGRFDTNHLNFDVYIGITDADNIPLSGYRVIGTHSSGLQIESQVSARDWTANSGAMHYKAGNIKYEAPNSPSGIWTLQLVDPDGNPAGPPVDFPFEASSPTWYFLLYQRQ